MVGSLLPMTNQIRKKAELLTQAADLIEQWSPDLKQVIYDALSDELATPEKADTRPRWKCPQPGCSELLGERKPTNHWKFSTRGEADKPASGVWHDPEQFPEVWPPAREPDSGQLAS